MIKVLHNNSCSKSRAILEFLDENGLEFQIVDIIENPPSVDELRAVIQMVGCTPQEITRKNEKLFKDNFADKQLSDDELLQVLSENPTLIQRPILIKGSVAKIGRPIENVRFFIDKP